MSHPRPARVILLALLACLSIALLAPAFASAASFQVDTTVDQEDENPGDGECETEAEACTLRAAIVEVNLGADPTNTISFDSSVFNGEERTRFFSPPHCRPSKRR